MKLIELHKKWCKDGNLSNRGLCRIVPDQYKPDLKLFHPHNSEIEPGWGSFYWGERIADPIGIYNSFRQTIVLLICVMNNEL